MRILGKFSWEVIFKELRWTYIEVYHLLNFLFLLFCFWAIRDIFPLPGNLFNFFFQIPDDLISVKIWIFIPESPLKQTLWVADSDYFDTTKNLRGEFDCKSWILIVNLLGNRSWFLFLVLLGCQSWILIVVLRGYLRNEVLFLFFLVLDMVEDSFILGEEIQQLLEGDENYSGKQKQSINAFWRHI